jgi:hypothetical protein
MEVTYYVRSVYGADLLYPVSDDANLVCDLAKTQTLSPYTVETLKAYGVTTQEVFKPRG